MGNDGGTLPSRSEILKKKEKRVAPTTNWWLYDRLTRQPLKDPVVADRNGFMFNKETLIELLLKGERVSGVSGLKDVTQLRFQRKNGAIQCPVTLDVLDYEHPDRFVFLDCGHVLGAKLVDQLKESTKEALACPVCNEPSERATTINVSQTEVKVKKKKKKCTGKITK